MVSSEHHNKNHRHSRVSVGVHGHTSGKGALGAMIIGGIIGAVINEASHQSAEEEAEEKKLKEKQLKESAIETQDIADRQRLNDNNQIQITKWYQVGKDEKCYQMQTASGVTDVLGLVDSSHCQPK